MRKVEADCRATTGEVGNAEHMLRAFCKAPKQVLHAGVAFVTVRGAAMNPVVGPPTWWW